MTAKVERAPAAVAIATFVVLIAMAASARAQEAEAPLVALPGAEAAALRTQARCIVCHGIGHTTRSRLTRVEWDETLAMMKKRGAELSADDAAVILDYLTAHYGPDGPPAHAQPLGATATTASDASDPAALLERHGCIACHAPTVRGVGPSFQEVADRYRAEKDAAAALARQIREGGFGRWGNVPMPPFPQIPAAEVEAIVMFLLSGKDR